MSLAEAKAMLAGLPTSEDPGRIRLELGEIAQIVLDAPRTRNALSVTMMRDLLAAVERLATWEGALVTLSSSSPGIFCAGGHLGEVRASLVAPGAGAIMGRAMASVLDALLALPQVVVAEADGPAVGGGAELLTACDLRVLTPRARIHFVHLRLGVVPGWGGAGRLAALLGHATALRVLARAEPLGPEAALALGLADAVTVDPAAWLAPLRSHAPAALRAVKAQLRAPPTPAAQTEPFVRVWGGPAHRAALDPG